MCKLSLVVVVAAVIVMWNTEWNVHHSIEEVRKNGNAIPTTCSRRKAEKKKTFAYCNNNTPNAITLTKPSVVNNDKTHKIFIIIKLSPNNNAFRGGGTVMAHTYAQCSTAYTHTVNPCLHVWWWVACVCLPISGTLWSKYYDYLCIFLPVATFVCHQNVADWIRRSIFAHSRVNEKIMMNILCDE